MHNERCIHNPNLFVITGGPGSGKTTLLLELERHGYPFAPEVAREIIHEQVKQGGTALPWANRALFAELMLQRSVDLFMAHAATTSVTFVDRGIPDSLCYARLMGLPDLKIRNACDNYRYAQRVFLAPFWREIYVTDSERKQDVEEAERTAELMGTIYRECGYEVIEVPKMVPEKRADFVLQDLISIGR